MVHNWPAPNGDSRPDVNTESAIGGKVVIVVRVGCGDAAGRAGSIARQARLLHVLRIHNEESAVVIPG